MEEEVENIAVIKSAFSALESVALETGPKRHSSVRLIAQISGLAVFVFPLGKYVLFFPVMIKRGARSELASRLEAMLTLGRFVFDGAIPLKAGTSLWQSWPMGSKKTGWFASMPCRDSFVIAAAFLCMAGQVCKILPGWSIITTEAAALLMLTVGGVCVLALLAYRN